MARITSSPEQAADQAAVAALSREYRPVLLRYFERRGVPAKDCEDAVQDAFTRLLRREGVASVEGLEGYMFETAASVAVDYYRRARARKGDAHEAFEDAFHGVEELSPEHFYTGREELSVLLTGLRELPERTRNVFILSRLENVRVAEITKRLGMSPTAVHKHLTRAIAHLSARLGRRL